MEEKVLESLIRLTQRHPESHKGDYGTGLIVSGSHNVRGCAALSTYAAIRSGIGKVILASYPEVVSACSVLVPEAVFEVVNSLKEVPDKLDFSKVTSLGIGPGIGLDWQTKEGLEYILSVSESHKIPVVIDADALRLLKGQEFLFSGKVITPHVGEFSYLFDLPISEIKANRKELALKYAKEYSTWVILKGKNTVVATPEGEVFVNPTGNPGMATAGSGDVLLGIVTAFLSLIEDRFLALASAVYLHGLAGDIAAKEKTVVSLVAKDIIEAIPIALRSLLN